MILTNTCANISYVNRKYSYSFLLSKNKGAADNFNSDLKLSSLSKNNFYELHNLTCL
jgi:hypothetical protein